MTQLPYAPLESHRFGLKVHRGSFESIPAGLSELLLRDRVDVAILRIPAGQQGAIASFENAGFPWIVADTQVVSRLDLPTYSPSALKNVDLDFVPVPEDEAHVLDPLVAEVFRSYQNHYTSNPWLGSVELVEGFQEWARSFVTPKRVDHFAWLLKLRGTTVGFVTSSESGDEAEVVLGGILPRHAGGGLYSDFIRFNQHFFKDRGRRTLKVSTQVWNYAVQKVWSREGFAMTSAFLTVHVNSLLSCTQYPCVTLAASEPFPDAQAALRLPMTFLESRFADLGVQMWNLRSTVHRSPLPNKPLTWRLNFPRYDDQLGQVFCTAVLNDDEDKIHLHAQIELRRPGGG